MAGTETYNISNKITEAWVLQDYYVKINDQEICDEDLVDFEAIYGGCEIKARLKFIDSKGISTGDKEKTGHLGIGGFITVGWTTAEGCSWEGKFSLKKIKTNINDKNQKLIQFDLEDLETRNFKGTYRNKAHQNKEFSKVIQEHVEKDKTEKTKEFKIVPPKSKKEEKMNIQVPANIDFHTFLKKAGNKFNYKFIKDKFTNYFVHKEHTEYNNLQKTEIVYEYNTSQYSFNRIVQFNIDGFDVDAYLSSIPKSTPSIDPMTNQSENSKKEGTDTKSKKEEVKESDSNSSNAKVKNEEVVKAHKGSKQGKTVAKDKQYFDVLNNAQKCSIWVPGRNMNIIGKKVTVVFPKPTYYNSTGNDEMFTGIWEVYGSRDKVIGMYYMMELFLRRAGEDSKDNKKSSNKNITSGTENASKVLSTNKSDSLNTSNYSNLNNKINENFVKHLNNSYMIKRKF